MKRSSPLLILLLLAFAGALHAAGAADAGRAFACPIPTAAFAHGPAEHEPDGAARLDPGSRGRVLGAALGATPPDPKAASAFGAALPQLPLERHAVPRRPTLGVGFAQTTYLLTRRLRI